MKEIILPKGIITLVDADKYDELMQYEWRAQSLYAITGKHVIYVVRRANKSKDITSMAMHRYLMQPKGNQCVDHINRNGLDNRLCNLRLCTQAYNALNTAKQLSSNGCACTSKYKGVTYDKRTFKWRARITHQGKYYNLGSFLSELDAALAYNYAAEEFFGEFAFLNDVNI